MNRATQKNYICMDETNINISLKIFQIFGRGFL